MSMSERLRVIAPVAVAMGGLYWLDGAARPLTGTLAFGCCAVMHSTKPPTVRSWKAAKPMRS